jgi:hypothetical protein
MNEILLKEFDKQLASKDGRTNWQAAIALGEFCESNPNLIWPLVLKWGSCDFEDTRAAIATCVLEHILEYHFADYFPLVKEEVLKDNRNFADTFSQCSKFGQSLEKKFEKLMSKALKIRS